MGRARRQYWKLAITHPLFAIEWYEGGLLSSLAFKGSESSRQALSRSSLGVHSAPGPYVWLPHAFSERNGEMAGPNADVETSLVW